MASLVDQVADGLTEGITTGRHAPGSILPPVKDLAERWQVSRTVVREALSRLSANGLISARQGRGVFVAESLPPPQLSFSRHRDAGNVQRIIELRMGMETEAAALAALNREEEDVEAIGSALQRMAKAVERGDVQAGVEADIDFHCGICTATGNEHFEALFVFLNQFFYETISLSRQNSAAGEGRGGAAQDEHREIFESIVARDVRRARRAARLHITRTAERLGLRIQDTEPEA